MHLKVGSMNCMGAAQQVQADHGLNAAQMADIQEELQAPVDAAIPPEYLPSVQH